MAKLDGREMHLFAVLKKMKTGKLIVSKYGGEIKHIETVVDEILAAKAEAEAATAKGLIRTQEGSGPAQK